MYRRKILSIITSLMFMFLILWNCSSTGKAYGEDDLVHVFADSVDWPYYEEVLYSVFGTFIRTPIPEREFLFKWISFEKFDQYKRYKNIFIFGRLDSKDPVSDNVRNILNPDVIEGVKRGTYFYIPKEDVWAGNQYVMFLVAESRDAMIQKIVDLGDLPYQDFKKYYYQRLKEQMFQHMEQKELEEYIEDNFPFFIRVQHDFFIADENLQENYVWIRRLDPDRSILVHWLSISNDFQMTTRWVIDERNRIAKKIYSGDIIVEEETRALSTQFKGRNAIKLEGTWRNDSLIVGGPFRNITFIDKETTRLYMLDYYVQAVGRRKVPFLDQLNVIIHTFQVRDKAKKESE